MKPNFSNICTAVILSTIAVRSLAAEFQFEEALYVIGSVASVRTGPRENARIAGKIPIGTKVTFLGTASDLNSNVSDMCPMTGKSDGNEWICVRSNELVVGYAEYWGGWIAADLLGREAPRVPELIVWYDKTPKANLAERRKLAERASALDPLSSDAQERLLGVLAEIPDLTAQAAAKRSFAAYQARQADAARRGDNLIFSFTHGFLEPIGEMKAGRVVLRNFDQQVNHDYRNRGHFYNLYSGGQRIGVVATETQFDCVVKTCPVGTLVRAITHSNTTKASVGLATNFSLRQRDGPAPTLTQTQTAQLLEMAQAWTKSSGLSAKPKKLFLQHIKQGAHRATLAVGQLAQDGRVVLIGSWVMGSMNEAHYGGPDDFYESLLIVAEQQHNGAFRPAPGSGSIADHGCAYFDHADLDGDGTDEIVLRCNQLEGQYGYRVLKRVGGRWGTGDGDPRP